MPASPRNDIGSYRSKFKLEARGTARNSQGYLTGTTEAVERIIWGRVDSRGGSIVQFADQSFSQQQYDISFRYRPDITEDMAITELNGAKRKFRIINMTNVAGRNEKLIARCVEATH